MGKVHLGESSIEGTGVFASVAIQKGEAVLRIDDSRVVDAANPLRPELGEYQRHCDYLADGQVVHMRLPERHINHCCDPNTFVRTINGARYVFALRDIGAGEEITFDYCINSGGDTIWQCNCGSPRCLKTIHSDFFHLPLERQIEYLPLLEDWYIAENREKVEALLRTIGV